MDLAPDNAVELPRARWLAALSRHGALLVALIAAGAGAAWGLSTGLVRLNEKWLDEYSYSHGYLVLVMSGWLLWGALQRPPSVHVAPSVLGLVALVVCTFGYLLANVLQFTLGMQMMLPPIVLALLGALGGLPLARRAVGAAAFLYFAIPIWDVTIRPLQIMATEVVTRALALSDLTIFIEGSRITTPAGSFEIGDACAGQRFLLVGITLAAFYGLNWYRTWRNRLMLVAVAVGFSLVSNWIRIYLLVRIGHATEMQHYLIAQEHYTFGWVIFLIVMIPVVMLARRLELAEGQGAQQAPRPGTASEASAAPARTLAFGALAMLVLASPAVLLAEAPVPDRPEPLRVDLSDTGWISARPRADWQPDFQMPHYLAHRSFERNGAVLDLFIAGYRRQQAESKLIANANKPEGAWHRTGSATRQVEGSARRVTELTLSNGSDQRLVWYWYRVGSFETHDRRLAKLLEVPALLMGRRDGAAVLISGRCDRNCDGTRANLARFVAAGERPISQAVESARIPRF